MNEKKRQFVQLSKELKCITSPDGSFVYINTIAEKTLGHSSDELLAKSILNIIYPEDQAKTNKAITKLIEEKNILELKNRCICKDGTALHISWRANYVKQSKEIYWIGHNITTYKNTVLVLQQTKKKYQNLFEKMNLGFVYSEIIVDKAGVPCDSRILQANKAFEKLTGTMVNAIVGKRVLEVFPDMEQEWIDILGKVALSQKPITFTNYNHNTDKHYEVHAFSPEKGMFIEIFTDVTNREREKALLKQSEALYEKVFNSMGEAFAICEVILDENGKPIDYFHLHVNPAFEKHTGFKREEVIGKTALEEYPDFDPFWIERFGKVALTQKPIEFTDYNKNINRYYHVISFSPEKASLPLYLEM